MGTPCRSPTWHFLHAPWLPPSVSNRTTAVVLKLAIFVLMLSAESTQECATPQNTVHVGLAAQMRLTPVDCVFCPVLSPQDGKMVEGLNAGPMPGHPRDFSIAGVYSTACCGDSCLLLMMMDVARHYAYICFSGAIRCEVSSSPSARRWKPFGISGSTTAALRPQATSRAASGQLRLRTCRWV